MRIDRALNVEDFQKLARRRLPSAVFDIIEQGVGDDVTLKANRSVFESVGLLPSTNPDVVEQRLAAVDRGNYDVLCLNLDTPIKPYRESDLRNNINVPLRVTPRLVGKSMTRPDWLSSFLFGDRATGYSLTATKRAYDRFSRTVGQLRPVTRDDIARLRERWPGRFVVKGLLSADDIVPLVELGVDAVVVSNHGGRNLDGSISTLEALPGIVAAVDGRLEVLCDSGFRRGTDVAKALALGADCVLIGRPYLYGLAAGGEAGVSRVLELLRAELEQALVFLGVGKPSELSRRHLVLQGERSLAVQ